MTSFFGRMNKTQKIQKKKPSRADIHFKYICEDCETINWISYKENQTDGYKICCPVCDSIIIPTKISNIKVEYVKEQENIERPKPVTNIVNRCCKTLCEYGFDQDEALILAKEGYAKYQTEDLVDLVKKIIFDFGVTIDEFASSKV
jgi:hypothetical protein